MQFLKRLFGSSATPKGRYITVYIKPKACQEILQVRIDTMNELSRNDEENGYFVRKLARGQRCPFQVEIEMSLDSGQNIIETTIINGTEATEADYNAFIATQPSKPNA
jgi:hypothetical protein